MIDGTWHNERWRTLCADNSSTPVLLREFLEGMEDVLDVGLFQKDGIERTCGCTRRPEEKYLLWLLDSVAPSKGELDVL